MSKSKFTCIIFVTILIRLAVYPGLSNSSTSPTIQWTQTYGGADDDVAISVTQITDGGYLLAGRTSSYGAGYDDFWLVKTDTAGAVQWNQTYGGLSDDSCSSLIQTTDGGYLLAGTIHHMDHGLDAFDAWLVKTDAMGIVQWNQTYGGLKADYGSALIQTTDGGFLFAGRTSSYGAGFPKAWLVKIDSTGIVQWNQTYGRADGDQTYGRADLVSTAKSLIQTTLGGYLLAVTINSILDNRLERSYVWLVKTDAMGIVQWNQTYGGLKYDSCSSLIQTIEGGFLFAGTRTSFGSSQNVWLVKTDVTGYVQWEQTYGGLEADYGSALVQTTDGGFLFAGRTNSYGAGFPKAWLVKIDSTGIAQWNQTYGQADGSCCAKSLIQTTDGGYLLAGYTTPYGTENSDMWLVKLRDPTESKRSLSESSSLKTVIGLAIWISAVFFSFALGVWIFRQKYYSTEKKMQAKENSLTGKK